MRRVAADDLQLFQGRQAQMVNVAERESAHQHERLGEASSTRAYGNGDQIMSPHSQPVFDENSAFGVLAAICLIGCLIALGVFALAAFTY